MKLRKIIILILILLNINLSASNWQDNIEEYTFENLFGSEYLDILPTGLPNNVDIDQNIEQNLGPNFEQSSDITQNLFGNSNNLETNNLEVNFGQELIVSPKANYLSSYFSRSFGDVDLRKTNNLEDLDNLSSESIFQNLGADLID